MKITWLFVVSLALAASQAAAAAAAIVPGKDYDRIVIILFENKDYNDATRDPYFSTIADNHNGVLLTNYFGVTHPSQPNYIALISGSTDGVNLDFHSNIDRKSVVDLLEPKGISWKTYQEGYPGNCYTGSKAPYSRRHNPFISFTNIANNTARCANIVDSDQLDIDIANNEVPQFVFFTPNMKNDGHETSLKHASNWTKTWLEPRMKEENFTRNTLFLLTWDENQTWIIKPNQVMAVMFGPAVMRSTKTDGVRYDHYSILKSVEENWDLGSLDQNDVTANALIVRDQAENGASEKIKNVVLLMLENRSFDRMMGWFKYSDAIDGLTGNEFNYLNPKNTSSPKIYVSNKGLLKDPLDPPHGYDEVATQLSGDSSVTPNGVVSTPMSGFVQSLVSSYPDIAGNATAMQQAMDGFDPSSIPITYALASNYTIIDRWFSSFPGSTMPNRMFVHSATSDGEVYTEGIKYIPGYSQRTIYHNLDDAGIEWRNYYELVPSLIVFNKLRLGYLDRYKNWRAFKDDAAAGNLPPVSFIDPAYFSIGECIPEDDNHPPADVAEGERLLKEVYETIRASPQWNNTLLIVTYDEHGGYYDHVPTPLNVPNPDGAIAKDFNFDRLGVRVPTILISPWVEKGGVIHKPDGPTETSEFEHSSFPATIKKLFNLPRFLNKRDAWAGTFEGAISLNSPREDCPVTLPAPPAPACQRERNTKFDKVICDGLKAILQGN